MARPGLFREGRGRAEVFGINDRTENGFRVVTEGVTGPKMGFESIQKALPVRKRASSRFRRRYRLENELRVDTEGITGPKTGFESIRKALPVFVRG